MKQEYNDPVYSIGITAKFLNVCQTTLRIWERKGLIKPARLGKNRFYSRCDIERLEHIKDLIQKKRINIQGAKNILSITPCWELKNCKPKKRNTCPVYIKRIEA
ncbi:MAG: MerR family transcriptional regulator [Candidatus Omnitrophica bacterium CG23_combo_of_CG06-09_8_20_14_all_40_11]|nr:MAG: MerR family transcriptional regulator [Candidatus Omnitrophica bacterium CG23_combo_of_CG06-09_8_20_14_all_40_11]